MYVLLNILDSPPTVVCNRIGTYSLCVIWVPKQCEYKEKNQCHDLLLLNIPALRCAFHSCLEFTFILLPYNVLSMIYLSEL